MKNKIKGFTLIELVITIAIIIVLSMISFPLYKNYVLNSKYAEGYILLSAIRDAQLEYYNEHRIFLRGGTYSCNNEVLGIDARINKYFTYFDYGYWFGSVDVGITSFTAIVKSVYGNIVMDYNITCGAEYH